LTRQPASRQCPRRENGAPAQTGRVAE
jgi:hypothetical protein